MSRAAARTVPISASHRGSTQGDHHQRCRQYREADQKGSLQVGKLADLAVLDGNPLTVDPMAIKDIKVVETIKEGRPSTAPSLRA